MKITAIRFENIHSFASKVEIDFDKEPLASTQIFAITGPTGAGKTTILDAITLAIYGRTPRIGDLTKNTIETHGSIISRGTSKAWAEVDYIVGNRKYTSRWAVERNRNGKLRDVEMQLIDKLQQKVLASKLTDVKNTNAEIIGLQYEEFVKSVVLAQGEFAKFLKADSDARHRLLEKITGVDIYRKISVKAYEIAKEKKQETAFLEQKIQDIDLLSYEEIEQIKKEKQTLLESLEKNTVLQRELARQIAVKEQIEALKLKLAQTVGEKEKVENQLKDSEKQFERLEKYKKLQNYSTELHQWQQDNKLSNQLKIKQKELQEKINTALANKQEKILEKKFLEESLKKLLEQKEKMEPVLNEVRKIDKQIVELKTILNEKNNRLKTVSALETQEEQQLANIKSKIKTVSEKIKSLEKYLKDNQSLELLESNIAKLEILAQEYDAKLAELQVLAQKLEIKEIKPDRIIDLAQKLKQQIKAIIDENQKEVKHKNLGIEELKQIELQKNQELKSAEELVKLHYELKSRNTELNRITDELSELEQTLQTNQANTEELLQKIEIQEKNLEIAKLNYQNAELAGNIQILRKALANGKPCPVCGSVHHPHKDHPVNTNADKLKKEKDTQEQKLNELLRLLDSLKLEQKHIFAQIEKLKAQQTNLIKENQNYTLKLKQLPVAAESYEEAQKLLENIKIQITAVRNDLYRLSEIQELNSKLNIIQSTEEQATQVQKIRNLLGQILNPYKQYFPDKYNNAKQAAVFLKKLLEQYKKSKEDFNRLSTENEKLKSQLGQIIQSQKQLLEEKQTLTAEIEQLSKNINDLVEKKEQLLPGLSPEEFENNLNTEISTVKDKIADTTAILSSLNTRIEQLLADAETTENELTKLKESIDTLEEKLLPIVKALGYNNLHESLNDWLDSQQAQSIEELKLNLEKQLAAFEKQVEAFTKQTEELQKSDTTAKTSAELQKELNQLEKQNKLINRQIGEIEQKLKNNQALEEKIEALKKELKKKQQENLIWQELANLIGSSEGDKFVRVAMEISMHELMRLANQFLKMFNDRYEMFIKVVEERRKRNSEIFVIDHYRAESERSVKTLSGGESFLLSLSLALALSQMASKNITIDSLFIDEGFGTLDQETLDVALNALQKLHEGTNKKIGIISHVEALKERITTKINVKKESSGYSKVQIIG